MVSGSRHHHSIHADAQIQTADTLHAAVGMVRTAIVLVKKRVRDQNPFTKNQESEKNMTFSNGGLGLGRFLRWRFSPPILTAGAVFMGIVFTVIWVTDRPSPPLPTRTTPVSPMPQEQRFDSEQTPETHTVERLETHTDVARGETGNTAPEVSVEQSPVPSTADKNVLPEKNAGKGHYTPLPRDPEQERRQELQSRLHEIRVALRKFPQGRITMKEFAHIQALRTERSRIQQELGQLSPTEGESTRLDLEIQTLLAESMSKDFRGFRVSDAPHLIQHFKKAGAFDMADKFQKAANHASENGEAFFTLHPEN